MPHKTTKYTHTHTHTHIQNNKIYTFFSSDELLPFSDELLISLPQSFVSHGNLCHGKNGDPKGMGKAKVGRVLDSTLGGKCETTQNSTFFSSDELLPFSDELLLSLPQPFVSHGNLCHGKNGDPKRMGKAKVGFWTRFWGENVR